MIEPKKFLSKPVYIEAVQHDGTVASANDIRDWVGNGATSETRGNGEGGNFWVVMIPTLEGVMRADPGDWVIKGTKGEFYPCKPDIFEEKYGEVL